ncbi:hypothetical protein SDC9_168072 [bioreactor metagenome]|uniref:Uncharacterized protein n=1 Tax=bioreactor metagenome TaxID=1076179 RepID=A0A645G9X6_9ZZZZ
MHEGSYRHLGTKTVKVLTYSKTRHGAYPSLYSVKIQKRKADRLLACRLSMILDRSLAAPSRSVDFCQLMALRGSGDHITSLRDMSVPQIPQCAARWRLSAPSQSVGLRQLIENCGILQRAGVLGDGFALGQ